MFRFVFIVCIAAFLATTQVVAKEMQDVVYLKNGGIVRGTVIEQVAGKSLKIVRFDGNAFRYKMKEIDKISKETVIRMHAIGKKKNPMVALGLSFPIVGAGQFYNGQYTKGVIQLGAAIAGLGFSLSASGDNYDLADDGGNVDADSDDWMSVPGYLLLFGGAIWSLIDAPMSANRINQQNQAASFGHLFQLDGDRATLGMDPVASRNGLGTLLTFRF